MVGAKIEGPSRKTVKSECRHSCSIHAFFKTVEALQLREEHRLALRNTPFGHFMDMPRMTVEASLLLALRERWSIKNRAFRLGNTLVKFEVEDVARILGVRGSGLKVRYTDNESANLANKWFGIDAKQQITLAMVTSRLSHLVAEVDEASVEIFTKVLIAHLFQTILFPMCNGKFKRSFLRYIDDLQNLGHYNWADAVHSFLVDGLDGGTKYLKGCTLALNVWCMEHTTLWKPPQPELRPLLFKWHPMRQHQLNTYRRLLSTLKAGQVIAFVEEDGLQIEDVEIPRYLLPMGAEPACLELALVANGGEREDPSLTAAQEEPPFRAAPQDPPPSGGEHDTPSVPVEQDPSSALPSEEEERK